MLDISQLREAVSERLAFVRAAKEEYDQLERALAALGGPIEEPTPSPPVVAAPDPAPYGYKADGTPRKRPGRRKNEAPAETTVQAGGVLSVKGVL